MEKEINIEVIDLRCITSWEKLNTLRLLLFSKIEDIEERYNITTFTNPIILTGKYVQEVIIFPGHYDPMNESFVIDKKQERKIVNQSMNILKGKMLYSWSTKKILDFFTIAGR
jgi:hypothetical protein